MYAGKSKWMMSDFHSRCLFSLTCLDLTLSPYTAGLRIELVATWGDFHYMGLTGLEIVGKDGESLPLDISMMAASPRDLNDLPEYGDDLRTLDKYD